MAYSPSPAHIQTTFAAPTGTTNTTGLMMGLGVAGAASTSITPQVTGRIWFWISGSMGNDTTADGCGVTLYFGTGTAPANGDAITGVAMGTVLVFTSLTGMLRSPFAAQTVIVDRSVPSITSDRKTGTLTPIWLDIAVKAVTAGTASVTLLNVTAFEF